MLTTDEFNRWCYRLNLSQQTQRLIEHIRSSEPSRRVGGGRENVAGRYPSRKMRCTISFESHTVEFPILFTLEHDDDVLEYFDQPPSIKLDYTGKNGQKLGILHTPDFFVIRSDGAGWEECKTSEDLKKLALKSPNRYVMKDGKWSSPPGENYARPFGLYYRLRSNNEINWTLQRNLIFLEDYFRTDFISVEPKDKDNLIKLVSQKPGILLSELLHQKEIKADDIYILIVSSEIYINLDETLLAEPNCCPVFSNSTTAQAYQLMINAPSSRLNLGVSFIDLQVGTTIIWDGKVLDILHLGERNVTLRFEDEKLIQLKRYELEKLIHKGEVKSLEAEQSFNPDKDAWERFYQARPEDQEEALRRYQIIEPYLKGEKRNDETTPARTIRDWKAKYKAAQQKYGCGYLRLLTHRNVKGNRLSKLPQNSLDLMEQFINDNYETLKQKTMWSVYCSLVDSCEAKGLMVPSYKTFTQKVHKRSSYEQTLKRQGRRAAYQKSSFYWELERTTAKHGDRPMEICHIDHTQLDVELVCSQTGRKLGRPWVSFLVDAFSRRLLAVYLTFDSPSYRSCLMVLRICVQRHGRLPQSIVVDNGTEFHSIYFETLLATYECTKKHRPSAKGRFGSVIERLFGTSNTQFVHNLLGNTQIVRNVRQVTKSVLPKNQAVWTLGSVYEYLTAWAYEVYDTDEHPALFMSPREAFGLGMQLSGNRVHRLIPYDENFKILTLPTTTSGKAKVQPSHGIKINYIYYWSNLFRDPEVENTDLPVRYDPFDAGVAYAFVKGQWVQCISQYYAIFGGRSEKELKLATAELLKRYSNHHKNNRVSAKKLAEFLSSVEATEIVLEQRLHDMEARSIFSVIDGGRLTPNYLHLQESPAIDVKAKVFDAPDSDTKELFTEPLVIYEEF
ncbi:integrase [Aphanothece hegewaldii CCALA 016]|uniref:Integrase n=1 Tax=Aphanothece hegewaldii CCALA 016 TaxID=2107694 RepID=A0A2T1LYY5_9CHRO|nr:DDE-type integrase/transposase/recombinase [Aphanothece hegewaldii]PSF37603.1 integrase [Aphanothece hegewaldii CCALA 016]